jgi:hypothetical protein
MMKSKKNRKMNENNLSLNKCGMMHQVRPRLAHLVANPGVTSTRRELGDMYKRSERVRMVSQPPMELLYLHVHRRGYTSIATYPPIQTRPKRSKNNTK